MLLKVVEGDGFKIYSGFEDIEYVLKGMNRYRAREGTKRPSKDYQEPPVVIEQRRKSAIKEEGWSPIHNYSNFYFHVGDVFPEEMYKSVHHAKLFFGDGVEKNIVFETGFLCNEQGETIEIIR